MVASCGTMVTAELMYAFVWHPLISMCVCLYVTASVYCGVTKIKIHDP